MTANKMKPGCVTDELATEWAQKYSENPNGKVVMENMQDFMKPGSAYPDNFPTMVNDLEYYKTKIPFDQVKVPTHMIHGDADPDINYSQSV